MNIILQNYKEVIDKIINNCLVDNLKTYFDKKTDYNVSSYIELLSSFDMSLCDCFKKALIALLKQMDTNYRDSIERKRKYHIKQICPRTILTIFGEITYHRTFYTSKLDGKSYCHIDRILGLKKYDYFDPYIKAEILDYVSSNNYSKTAEHINLLIGNRISIYEKTKYLTRQTVRNVVLKSVLAEPCVKKLPDVERIFVMADEKWIPTQNNNKKKIMQKSIVVFDGFNKKGNRKSLNNKMTFSNSKEDFIYESIDYIEKAYDTSKIKEIILLGDGAKWIDGLKYYFNYDKSIKIIQGLDHFHLKQCLWRICSQKDVYDTLVKYINEKNKTDFIRLVDEIIDCNESRKEKIETYKKYVLSHWVLIINLFKYNLSCPMESQISHTFASYFTSRPKGYSPQTLQTLMKLRLKKANKYNIKELFFKNFNNNEIINLNEKNMDYSIFNRKNTYTAITKKPLFRAN